MYAANTVLVWIPIAVKWYTQLVIKYMYIYTLNNWINYKAIGIYTSSNTTVMVTS